MFTIPPLQIPEQLDYHRVGRLDSADTQYMLIQTKFSMEILGPDINWLP